MRIEVALIFNGGRDACPNDKIRVYTYTGTSDE